jgi:glycosyltransferase involved in cell wall biosynthesis
MGFLVEALRDRGVDAWGIDISPYAVSRVRADTHPYCAVASVLDLVKGNFDLVTCFETLEHISSRFVRKALRNVTALSNLVLISTPPSNHAAIKHGEFRLASEWVALFEQFDFTPDFSFDASFITPYAILFRREVCAHVKCDQNGAANHTVISSKDGRCQAKPTKLPPRNSRRVLIVSGQGGPTFRYRCQHLAEEFGFLGWGADITELNADPGYLRMLSSYNLVILHRLPYSPQTDEILGELKSHRRRVLFDVDDLIFRDETVNQIPDARENEQVYQWLVRLVSLYRETLKRCTGALVSTGELKDEIRKVLPRLPVWVIRNAVSDIMVTQAQITVPARTHTDRFIRLGYFSGTSTHNWDFARCCPSIMHVMKRRSDVKLILAGPIDVPKLLLPILDRIEVVPSVPWRELPTIMLRADINLAPLEANSLFTACKSEVKYLEAALLGIPTVASDVGGFRTAIQNGDNGFLCGDDKDWVRVLGKLIGKGALREQIGSRAQNDVLLCHTTRTRSAELGRVLEELSSMRYEARQYET